MMAEERQEPHVFEDIPAYALGCLEDSEQVKIRAHVENCSLCQAELAAYQGVVDRLPLAAPLQNPRSSLKEDILRQVRPHRTTQALPQRTGWVERFLAGLRSLSPAWGVASLVLIAALGVSNLLLWQQVRQQDAAPPVAQAFRTISLKATDASPKAEGILIISPDGRYGTLVVDNLEPLQADQVYQLWLVLGETRTSGGTFSVGSSGYAALEVDSPQPLSDFSGFGITIEPAGGSPGPTGPRVLGS